MSYILISVVTASGDSNICIFDPLSPHSKAILTSHKYAINCLATAPGGLIVSGSYDSSVKIWNISKLIKKLEKQNELEQGGGQIFYFNGPYQLLTRSPTGGVTSNLICTKETFCFYDIFVFIVNTSG